MSSNKHIVWIVPGFASSEKDDTCIPTLLDFLQHIKKNSDAIVSVIALQYPFTDTEYEVFGSKVYPMNGRNKWLRKASVWKKALNKLAQLDSQHPIHCIHSFWLGDTTLIAHAFSKGITKYICTLMGQDALSENRHLQNVRLANTYTIALTEMQAEHFYRNAGRRVHEIIPFGIPELRFNGSDKKYDICGVGSLSPLKNYEMWIDIVEATKKQVPSIKAILIGDGEQREELHSIIDKKGLAGCITLVGLKSRSETLELMEQSKIFVHTSRYEGQGYVFSEAMSKKLAILSTPVGYALENEKIWKGNSPEEFADEINYLLRKTDLKVNYTFPQMKDTWEKYKKFYL